MSSHGRSGGALIRPQHRNLISNKNHNCNAKKIHAVTMRPDGLEQNDTSAAAAPHSVTSGRAPGVKPSAGPALAGRNQPLSLVPDAQGHVEARPRTGAVSKNRTEDSVQDHNSK